MGGDLRGELFWVEREGRRWARCSWGEQGMGSFRQGCWTSRRIWYGGKEVIGCKEGGRVFGEEDLLQDHLWYVLRRRNATPMSLIALFYTLSFRTTRKHQYTYLR